MHKFLLPLFALAFLLTGCTSPENTEPTVQDVVDIIENEAQEEEEVEEEPVVRETKNVRYSGVVRPSGISIYQEGTHRLLLDDGRFILLESDTADLNGYVGEEVDIRGALRPTVEAGGMIMRVEEISLKDEEDVDEEESSEESSEGEEETESEEKNDDVSEDEEEDEEEVEVVSDEEGEEPVETEDDTEDVEEPTDEEEDVEEPTSPVDSDLQALIDSMASQNYEASQWTNEYCSSHIGFCVPMHRNWWFKSFGATTSSLWHVETSGQEVEDLWDGPIRIDLVAGGVGGKKATDGQIRPQDSNVVGYKEWSDNRHFEVTAHASLEAAVRYIIDNIRVLEE